VVKRACIAAVLGALSIGSCTIYGLSDEIHQEQCTFSTEDLRRYDDCEALNDRSAPGFDTLTSKSAAPNRCHPWRCGENHYCEIAPLDQDRDGFTPSLCLDEGQMGDCDDLDPEKRPGHEELCDGKDNDCDRSIDEGMLQAVDHVAVVVEDEIQQVAYASNEVTEDVGVAYRRTGDGETGFAVITSERATKGQQVWLSASADVFHAASVNVATRSGSFVLGVIEGVPTQRIWVGDVIAANGYSILQVDEPNLRRTGLRCSSDEPCAEAQGPRYDESTDDDPAPTERPTPSIPGSTEPALSVLGTSLLVGYARGPDGAYDGCDADAPHPPLLLNYLNGTSRGWDELTTSAIRLGDSLESRSPRLVAIDAGLVTASIGPFGWLAAYVDTEGGLVVRQVRQQPEDALSDLQLRLTREPEPWFQPELVQGPVEDNRMLIGVAARAGCAEQSRIVFGLLQLTWDSQGDNELRVYRELAEVGNPGQQGSRPVLAYNRSLSNWGVAYETPDGVYARVLDRNGQPIGPSAYRMTQAPPYAPDVAIISGGPDAATLFTVYTYEDHPDQTPSHSIVAHALQTCRDTTTLVSGD
jgi:Putative metal-binding motif